jgi:hypothetical protein
VLKKSFKKSIVKCFYKNKRVVPLRSLKEGLVLRR